MTEHLGFSHRAKDQERLRKRRERMDELGLTGMSGIFLINNIDELQYVADALSLGQYVPDSAYTDFETELAATLRQLLEAWRADIKRRNGVEP